MISMEKDSNISISSHDDCSGTVVQSVRDMHPAHYILKIDSFSFLVEMLKESGAKSYDSDIFEASGHKWKLTLFPSGDKERNGEGYISLYLSIQDTLGWDVYAEYKFFVLDQIRDEYLTFQDAVKKVRRFRENKKEWGIARLLSRNDFDDATKGYLMQDICVFGVEILVCNYNGRGECLGQPHKLIGSNSTYTWKVTNYSTLPDDEYQSPVFTLGNCKWKVALYPKGNHTVKGESVSMYLELDDLNPIPRVYASYKMSIKNQYDFAKHWERKATHLFSATSSSRGWHNFLSLKDIEDPSKGFLVKDTLIVEVEINRISTVKSFS